MGFHRSVIFYSLQSLLYRSWYFLPLIAWSSYGMRVRQGLVVSKECEIMYNKTVKNSNLKDSFCWRLPPNKIMFLFIDKNIINLLRLTFFFVFQNLTSFLIQMFTQRVGLTHVGFTMCTLKYPTNMEYIIFWLMKVTVWSFMLK